MMACFSLRQIADKVNGKIFPKDSNPEIKRICSIDEADSSSITFLSNRKYISFLKTTKAAAVLVDQSLAEQELQIPHIVVQDSYFAFREIMIMYHGERPIYKPGISSTAVIGDGFHAGQGIFIADFVVIGDNVSIGDRTAIYCHSYIGSNSVIGANCLIHPGVKIMFETSVGNNVILHPGAVIGSDGFGFALKGAVRYKIPQMGRVILEDDVEIGANATIDRATMGTTRIKRGTKIDNLVQVGHNVTVGEDCAFAAQVGIAGSSKIGDRVVLAGQVGLAGHLEMGDDVMVGAQSGVPNNVPPQSVLFGCPARDIRLQKRIEAILGRLPDYINRLRALEKKLLK
ncbi:MAG: UDP-3-O-(3-hydroxymyristoyl)glucosamine N-acyltransferase [candidate division Zixibacteria bacterium CG_4_9_14_3_um_filter_46_8]|nr:MAG: UDP-3-O-(3-hydroxymyristoyl)glucosamine N-acyltransferase [candidate division Zixibacteria bacterium CG_4_9_14_3_um_filter_46_8]